MNYLPLLLILTACHTPIAEEIEKDLEHGIDVHLDIEEDKNKSDYKR